MNRKGLQRAMLVSGAIVASAVSLFVATDAAADPTCATGNPCEVYVEVPGAPAGPVPGGCAVYPVSEGGTACGCVGNTVWGPVFAQHPACGDP